MGSTLNEITLKLQEKRCTLGTRYLADHRRHDILIEHPLKPPSNDFGPILNEITLKLQEKRFIPVTVGTRYLGGLRRHDILVEHP